MKTSLTQAALFLILLTFAFPAYGRREVESAEKLAFLNQATGSSDTIQSSSTSSFQARFDAIMNTDATMERELVGTQDAYNQRQEALEEKLELDAEMNRVKELNPERYDPLKARTNFKVQEEPGVSQKLDAGEQTYLKERAAIQKEFDERIQKKPTAVTPTPSPSSESSDSPIKDALANNPFYKGGEFRESENAFEEQKAVIRARLLGSGYPEDTVQRWVNSATNEEDVIRNLMKDNDVSYGEASDMVS